MSFDRLLMQLVGSYNPEDATNLPYEDQRIIVHEITGYWVNTSSVIRKYLTQPDLGVLIDDPQIATQMAEQIMPFQLTAQNLRDYASSRFTDRSVLAREERNFNLLESDQDFEQLLLKAGTRVAIDRLLVIRVLTVEDTRTIISASLTTGDSELISFVLDEFGPLEDPELILSLTNRQISNAVRYEKEVSPDYTSAFVIFYFLHQDVGSFIDYIALWDEGNRCAVMSKIEKSVNSADIDVATDNPVVRAFIELYPNDVTSHQIAQSGLIGIRQTPLQNNHDLYRVRFDGQIFAENRYAVLSQQFTYGLASHEILQESINKVNLYRQLAGQPLI